MCSCSQDLGKLACSLLLLMLILIQSLKSGVVTERFGFGTPASPYRPPLGVKEFGLWIEVSAAFYRLAKFHVKPSFRLRFLSDIL